MKSVGISGTIVLIMLLTIVIVEDLSAAEVEGLFEEAIGGALGGLIIGHGLGVSLTLFVIAPRLGETKLFYPVAMTTYHAPVIAGSSLGVYIAGNRDGSLLWTVVGSSVPTLINMIYVGAFENDKVYEFFKYEFGLKCRGSFPGIFFSPIGAVIGYELSRSNSSQQKKGQFSEHAAPALYIPLFRAKF